MSEYLEPITHTLMPIISMLAIGGSGRTRWAAMVTLCLLVGIRAAAAGWWAAVPFVTVAAGFATVMFAMQWNRIPYGEAHEALRVAGGQLVEDVKVPRAAGELWDLPAGLSLVATIDDDRELSKWVRAAQDVLRHAPAGTTLLMVSEDATEQQRTILGSEVHITNPDALRKGHEDTVGLAS